MRRKIFDFQYQNQDFSASMLGRGFRTQLGFDLEAKLAPSYGQVGQKSGHVGPQNDSETILKGT